MNLEVAASLLLMHLDPPRPGLGPRSPGLRELEARGAVVFTAEGLPRKRAHRPAVWDELRAWCEQNADRLRAARVALYWLTPARILEPLNDDLARDVFGTVGPPPLARTLFTVAVRGGYVGDPDAFLGQWRSRLADLHGVRRLKDVASPGGALMEHLGEAVPTHLPDGAVSFRPVPLDTLLLASALTRSAENDEERWQALAAQGWEVALRPADREELAPFAREASEKLCDVLSGEADRGHAAPDGGSVKAEPVEHINAALAVCAPCGTPDRYRQPAITRAFHERMDELEKELGILIGARQREQMFLRSVGVPEPWRDE